ncbi:MAG TPA: hypothetical protein P5205_19640 [Candidatus Paceibacterota bacterium]|nr:hypothetical protein [Verrucomicrobiota bacterium]HSA12579.1 hypothetical protein [Candidatus Paceibacterota bacterium]
MKKNGQTSQPAAGSKKQYNYSGRLEAEGVTAAPLTAAVKPPRQFQLAHLAATLARGTSGDVNVGDLVAVARQIWDAAGRELLPEVQARGLMRGLLLLNAEDWTAHAEALILTHNDLASAAPGRMSPKRVRESRETARCRAGLAVSQVWGYGPGNDAGLKALFQAKNETEATRGRHLGQLLRLAKGHYESCEVLALRADGPDLLRGCMEHAWEPLGIWDQDAFNKSVERVKGYVADPDTAFRDPQLMQCPIVARWLAVMRQEQFAVAKTRK